MLGSKRDGVGKSKRWEQSQGSYDDLLGPWSPGWQATVVGVEEVGVDLLRRRQEERRRAK